MTKPFRSLAPLILFFLLLACGSALAAAAPPPPDQDAAEWLKALYAAFTSKAWGTVAGVVLIGLVYPLRRFGPAILKTPFGGLALAFVVSLAATLGAALAVGVSFSLALVASSLATAATAAGIWEWLKAHIPGVQEAAIKAGSTPTGTKFANEIAGKLDGAARTFGDLPPFDPNTSRFSGPSS
jgi:hypothetical protein